ncbi:GspH/FimT family pseudopilin [Ralstonia sp. L16]|uniref:GspH/FimT family pseudopilin n=1 Tax=Ralstonia sp. L16 TaxID=3423950 RepID=UPI003F792A2E
MGPGARRRGFTLIELLVTISVFAFLMLLAAPSFTSWIQDAQVRTAAESLQNGLRVAQAEAARRHRQVAMVLTNGVPNQGVTAQANGKNWFVTVIPNTTAGESYTQTSPSLMVQSGTLGAVAPNAQLTGQAAVCFNSLGRLTTLNDGTYNCTIPLGYGDLQRDEQPVYHRAGTERDREPRRFGPCVRSKQVFVAE